MRAPAPNRPPWPEPPYDECAETCTTLHLRTRIVGKIRLAKTAWVKRSWRVAPDATARGLAAAPIPDGARQFRIYFDSIGRRLVSASDGERRVLPLAPMSVADFYRRPMGLLAEPNVQVRICEVPNPVPDPIPFGQDPTRAAYDQDCIDRYRRVPLQADRALKDFGSPAEAA